MRMAIQIVTWCLWVLLVLACLATCAFMFLNSGCDNVKVTPASVKITVVKATDPKTGIITETRTVESQSIGISGRAANVDVKKIAAPTASLAQIGEANAGAATGLSFEGLADSPFLGLYILGGLLIVAGVIVIIWLKQWLLGIALAVAGFVLIVACVLFDKYPWVALVMFGVALIGGTIWLIWYFRNAAAAKAALTTVTKVIENASTDVQAAIKPAVADAAAEAGQETLVRNAISMAKGP